MILTVYINGVSGKGMRCVENCSLSSEQKQHYLEVGLFVLFLYELITKENQQQNDSYCQFAKYCGPRYRREEGFDISRHDQGVDVFGKGKGKEGDEQGKFNVLEYVGADGATGEFFYGVESELIAVQAREWQQIEETYAKRECGDIENSHDKSERRGGNALVDANWT